MEQQGVLLRGIARVLNAGGSALLNIYDAATSIKTIVLPGEKGTLSAQMREYERKLELIYGEIGKEVALREESAGLSAAAEAGIKLVAEYQAEIEKIRLRLQEIAAEEKAAAAAKKEAAPASAAAARAKTAPEAATEETRDVSAEVAETPAAEMAADVPESAEPEAAAESTDNTPEISSDILVTATETLAQKLHEKTTESEAPPVAGVPLTGAETKQEAVPEVLEEMLKSTLLKLCADSGMDADPRMTKAALIELIKKGRG